MDNNARFKLAKEIMARVMAIACSNGFDPNDPVIMGLLEEEKELNKFNEEIIDKIINVYSEVIKIGDLNG